MDTKIDIVFCLDASASMGPCIEAVKANIDVFVKALAETNQGAWDVRLDYVAYSAGSAGDSTLFRHRSLRTDRTCRDLYRQDQSEPFFTRDVSEFCAGLSGIEVGGDEANLVALDTALDFPWRDRATCRRAVVLLSDEPVETGVYLREQEMMVDRLVDKIQALGVVLLIVAPESRIFDDVSEADGCRYIMVDESDDGLANARFDELMETLGATLSITQLQYSGNEAHVPRALFEQDKWIPSSDEITGR